MKEIPIERATELFEYNEDSGVLTLKRTRVGSLARKGNIIGTKDSRGHLQVKIDQETNKPIPQEVIDARAEARTKIIKEENANIK